MLAKIWRKRNTLPLLVWLQTGTSILEICLAVPQKLDIVLLEDPAISLLGIYPEDVPTGNKNTFSTMFILALFIIARSCKEHRCPSTEEWVQKNVVHSHNGVLFSYKKWMHEILRQMDRTKQHHPEWGNPITKEHTWYVLTAKWILAPKLQINKIEFPDPH